MGSMLALSVTASCGGVMILSALALAVLFPRVTAARVWAVSWAFLALGCLAAAVSPLVEPYFQASAEAAFRTGAVLAGTLALAWGHLSWFPGASDRRQGGLVRSFLVGGTGLSLVVVVLGMTSSRPVVNLAVLAWTGVPVVVCLVLVVQRGLGASASSVRAQSASLMGALGFGWAPFVLSWMVLSTFPVGGWTLGMPVFLVVGALLTLRGLVHFDTRFHHHQSAAFVAEKTLDTVIFLDAGGRVQAVNPALKFLLGKEEPSVVGLPLSDLGADATSSQVLKPLEGLASPDWEGTLTLGHGSGHPVPVHLVFRRVHNPAREAVGAVILVYDLRLPRRLDLSSREDNLTALSNRRWVLELLEAEFHRSLRYGSPLSALWIVVDHLVEVEQRFGSEASDDVLRRLGAVLRGGLRKTDFAGRVGHFEFLVVLPETIEERALLVSSRLEKMFALSSEGESSGVTLRVGRATLPAGVETVEAFVGLVKSSVPVPVPNLG